MLDCFCGLGGASEGFHQEGFECTGIDIVDVGYPYKLILKDMRKLNGKDFQGYDVIWGSPPCRDFSLFAENYKWTARWKKPRDIKGSLDLINSFVSFVQKAKPKFWIMENVPNLQKYFHLKPKMVSFIETPGKKRAFWGHFPSFLMPLQEGESIQFMGKPFDPMKKWLRSKIPLACSLAFARACKTQLLEA